MTENEQLLYKRPVKWDYGIGIVGAGGIVNGAHLPAYRKAGLNVAAICDINDEAAEQTAGRWGVTDHYSDFRALLERDDIQIIDIAIPNEGRIDIVKQAVAAGKHILIQKPFAHRYEQAVEMVQAAKKAGVRLAVNQNARFAPFYAMVKRIIDSGELGEIYLLTHEMRINQDANMGETWFSKIPHFLIIDYEIHHIDLMRYWSGQTPVKVYASVTKMAGQNFESEMTALTTMEFASGLRASLIAVDTQQADDNFFRFTVEGSKGSLYGHIGNNYSSPSIEYTTKDHPGERIRPAMEGSWFPDAFYGTMFELMNSINEQREASISGEDNIHTLRLLHGVIESIETQSLVYL
ncbi:Gfo/Idh/MocA family protein [Cohnella yongneupensis]|uniref:Gfo/Idh/MocA family protein n=1 Tax=Cohnella yongneupensis TaxID=425006 RepID=A0ABW0R411_9BACL